MLSSLAVSHVWGRENHWDQQEDALGPFTSKEPPLWCHPLLGTHVGIHSSMGTLFELIFKLKGKIGVTFAANAAPKLKSPEETRVNIPTVWSRL